ncbi:three-helix bundle dimerization domain-containing protein [Microbacterium ulmi]|uniref:Uncharacterized protein n=1 Tax=Microbacterium ulmi TaxID=179095 RepID=A0A7Y2PZ01_9MICO|nr:hypothetical protein [Microbacterium ulmi]NII68928.1 uncharacterized protein with HEPN domain [Microbacterium ulmi]NNH03911.1 hypothetical protein [Microbacterium ulmi]
MTQDIADDAAAIDEIVERLTERFPALPATTIREVVVGEYEGLDGAHVRDFVAVLVEKQAKKRLKTLGA